MILTIFTPTYNRAYILHKLYKSLCEQTCKDFVWLIVDDGSTDNTQEIVEKWKKNRVILIDYYKQTNGGKMRAHNLGARLTKTEWFMCIDSDDQLKDSETIQSIADFIQSQKEKITDSIAGIIAFKEIKGHLPIGAQSIKFPENCQKSTLTRLYEKGFHGETTLVFKTNVLCYYPFPEIEGEKFVTEAIAYDLIDLRYEYLLFPRNLQICEYQNDGYTMNLYQTFLKYPKGYSLYFNQLIKIGKGKMIRNISNYIATSLMAKDWFLLHHSYKPFLTLLSLPLGIYKYFKFKHLS